MRTLGAKVHTAPAGGGTVLVLAPHADDETLGCGGLIAQRAGAGADVVVVVVADGAEGTLAPGERDALVQRRKEEAREAVVRLGLPPTAVRFLDLPDGSLSEHETALEDALRGLLDETGATEVFATAPEDPHPDHAALGRCVRRSVQGRAVTLLEYPVWQRISLRATLAALRTPVVAVPVDPARKAHALGAYTSQLGDRDALLPPGFLAAFRGSREVFLVPPV